MRVIKIITALVILGAAGLWFNSFSAQITPQILSELSFGIEKNNPVPELKHWNKQGKTYYYFNWGEKPTAGYSLKVVKIKRKIIKLQALTPEPGVLVAQILTYPSLLICLPEGDYKVEVVDRSGYILKDFFIPKYKPLQVSVFLPHGKELAKREILRNPFQGNEGKTQAQIALEALFGQEEIADFVNVGINVVGASMKGDKWFVLLTKSYDNLTETNQALITKMIDKTVLALKTETVVKAVRITTNPEEMPELKNITNE